MSLVVVTDGSSECFMPAITICLVLPNITLKTLMQTLNHCVPKGVFLPFKHDSRVLETPDSKGYIGVFHLS